MKIDVVRIPALVTNKTLRDLLKDQKWHDWEKAIKISSVGGLIVYCSVRAGGPGREFYASSGDFIGRNERGGFFVLQPSPGSAGPSSVF